MRRSDKGHLTNPCQSTLPCPNPDPNLNRNPNPDPNPNTNPNPNPKCVKTVVLEALLHLGKGKSRRVTD